MYKEELCASLWVKVFKFKVDENKSSLYLKRASSLVLTKSWSQEAGNMIPGVGGHVEPWATQAFLTTGSSLSSTSPMLESRPVAHVLKRIRSLDIYVQSTDFNIHN